MIPAVSKFNKYAIGFGYNYSCQPATQFAMSIINIPMLTCVKLMVYAFASLCLTSVDTLHFLYAVFDSCNFSRTPGNRSRVDDMQNHPYMRHSPFMQLPGQLPNNINIQLLKDGRLGPGLDNSDPRIPALPDVCQQG